MRKPFIIILAMLSYVIVNAMTGINNVDSIAVIIRPEEIDSLELCRSHFVFQCADKNGHKQPIFLFNDKDDIAELVAVLTTDSVCMDLGYDTNFYIQRLLKTPAGDFDIKGGFVRENDMNVYALLTLFESGTPRFIWIGKELIDIGTYRYFSKDIYKRLKAFMVERFGSKRVFHSNR